MSFSVPGPTSRRAGHASATPLAMHHGMFALDIIGFGRRAPAIHPHLREALYRIVTTAFTAIGAPLEKCHDEDRAATASW